MARPELYVVLKPITDRPRDLWLAQLGSHGDAPCGTGATVPEALEDLALRLRKAADLALDDVIAAVASGVPIREALKGCGS